MTAAAGGRRFRAAAPFLLALAAVAAAAGITHGRAGVRNLPRHHWEDWRFFRYTRAEIHSVSDCFTRPSAWPGLYRPLTTNCYYFAGRSLWGNRVQPYHLVNAAVYLANGVLLFAVAKRLLPVPLALLASALWTSRMAHRQLVLFTSEFQALFAALLSLVALVLALPPRMEARERWPWPREAAALLAFAAALLSKESAVVLPAIVSATTWLFGFRSWRRDLPWWALAAAWVALYMLVFRGVSGYAATGFTYDVSAAILSRYAAYALMLSNAVVMPVDDWALPARVPALAAHPLVVLALALSAAAVLALLVMARRIEPGRAGDPVRVMALGLVWFLAGTAPFVVFEGRLFLRYAYFGSGGLSLLVLAIPPAAAEWWRLRQAPRAAAPGATAPTTAPAPP